MIFNYHLSLIDSSRPCFCRDTDLFLQLLEVGTYSYPVVFLKCKYTSLQCLSACKNHFRVNPCLLSSWIWHLLPYQIVVESLQANNRSSPPTSYVYRQQYWAKHISNLDLASNLYVYHLQKNTPVGSGVSLTYQNIFSYWTDIHHFGTFLHNSVPIGKPNVIPYFGFFPSLLADSCRRRIFLYWFWCFFWHVVVSNIDKILADGTE